MNRIYPTEFPYLCPHCNIPDTLPHMILDCPCEDRRLEPPGDGQATPAPQDSASTPAEEPLSGAHETSQHNTAEKWEALLVDENPVSQKRLVNRAKTAATARGFLD